MTTMTQQNLILVTGPAGAGRLTALRALEDLGFETIDNLPLAFTERVLGGEAARPLALGIDARARDFEAERLVNLVHTLRRRDDLAVTLVFLECADDVLLRRYSETRRRHPLAQDSSAADGIQRDRHLMDPIREAADICLDTSAFSVHDLRDAIDQHFAPRDGRFLAIQVQSFSYKRGLPQGLDMVFDVRFLRNPHWVEALRSQTGRAPKVAEYVAGDPLYAEFYEKVSSLILMLLPAYKEEGKSYLSVGFGCTGGKHRSVALTESLAQTLSQKGWQVSVRHRELERNAALATERPSA